MMNRIEKKFHELRARKEKALIVFVTAGHPDLKATRDLVLAFERAGVDMIELGVPFSDPLADGPVIQQSSYQALKRGVTLDKILSTVREIRKHSDIPLALMTYYNPVFHQGEARFVEKAAAAGVDGLIVPDLPPEEAGVLVSAARRAKLATVFFLSPATGKDRIRRIVDASTGFIYFVSVTGVTGARTKIPLGNFVNIKAAKRVTAKPVCVGFGISTPLQARQVSRHCDGVIVGSAVVKEIERLARTPGLVSGAARLVASFVKAVKK